MVKKYFVYVMLLLLISFSASAMEVAITVDDLPTAGTLPPKTSHLMVANEMLAAFQKHHVTDVYGFINGDKYKPKTESAKILQEWVTDGQLLGNHVYSHFALPYMTAAKYIALIQKNNPILEKYMGNKNYRYFRYTFLAEGETRAKRDAVRQYLAKNHYTIAPVTTDFADFRWNTPYARCVRKHDEKGIAWLEQSYLTEALYALQRSHALAEHLFNRDVKYVLLVHIGAFDAKIMDKLLNTYEHQGVKFISLPEALSDQIYKTPPDLVTPMSYTYLTRIRVMRRLSLPQDPKKLAYEKMVDQKLNTICK